MKTQTIHIRNMCCQRCIEAVSHELKLLGLVVKNVKLGEATFSSPSKINMMDIEKSLNKRGFILVKNDEEIIVENVKTVILDLIHHLGEIDRKNINLPSFLEEKIKLPYRTLLKIFRKQKGMTIQNYFILQRLEKVKELIEQSNLNFSEVSNVLGYKSPQHLSGQFRQITGMTMLKYKKLKIRDRIPIDTV